MVATANTQNMRRVMKEGRRKKLLKRKRSRRGRVASLRARRATTAEMKRARTVRIQRRLRPLETRIVRCHLVETTARLRLAVGRRTRASRTPATATAKRRARMTVTVTAIRRVNL
jgi:hypothetical protein